MGNATKKVGSTVEVKQDKTEKKEKVRRPDFDLKSALNAAGSACELDDKNRLNDVPVNYSSDFSPLKKNNFSHRSLFFLWKAECVELQKAKLDERKAEFIEMAEEAKTNKPSRKRQIKKIQKLNDQMGELKKLLVADGMSPEDLEELMASIG